MITIRRFLKIIIFSAAICGVYYLYLDLGQKIPEAQKTIPTHNTTIGEAEEVPNIGGPFALIDQDGRNVTDKDFHGKKMLVYFGFTHCPDICPVTMAVLTEVMNQLETSGIRNVQPVFITVDPEQDTPEVLKNYLKDYYKNFEALTGSKAEIGKVEKEYKVYAEKSAGDMMSHTDLIYYMDENGKFLHHFTRENAPEDIVDYVVSH